MSYNPSKQPAQYSNDTFTTSLVQITYFMKMKLQSTNVASRQVSRHKFEDELYPTP